MVCTSDFQILTLFLGATGAGANKVQEGAKKAR